jgi:hypothetical protein
MQKPVTIEALAERLSMMGFVIASLLPGSPIPSLMAVVFLALALWGYDALRYTLTESCIAQVRQAYNALLSESSAAGGLTSTSRETAALDAGQRVYTVHDERLRTSVK